MYENNLDDFFKGTKCHGLQGQPKSAALSLNIKLKLRFLRDKKSILLVLTGNMLWAKAKEGLAGTCTADSNPNPGN